MDTRKLNVETYACGCDEGVEYGILIKDTNPEITEGDDELVSIVTHQRYQPDPKDEAEAYNAYGQQDFTAELVRRYNNFPALVEALEGLLKATRKAKEWAEVQPQFADDDGHFVGEWIDEARALLATLKP